MKPRKKDVVALIGFRVALVALAMGLFGSVLTARFAPIQAATRKGALNQAEIIALQEKFQKASVAGDMPELSALMTDNATVIHGNGLVQTKAEYINSITSGKMKFTAYDLKDSKVIFFKDGAIVVGVADIVLAPSHGATAAPHPLRMQISSVWLRKLDGWQLILSQDTPFAGSSPSAAPKR
ncbi:MAG TPA: nuclear transport factor 2 family protein [Candidatus Acidoferrales bacterium]|jgi:ketosteroid isomerase-like protein|nr:nuclear transport factor 2 family protein [Candidatus Acidoferrales bacterium]